MALKSPACVRKYKQDGEFYVYDGLSSGARIIHPLVGSTGNINFSYNQIFPHVGGLESLHALRTACLPMTNINRANID